MVNKSITVQLLFFGVFSVSGMLIVKPGPKFPPTKGEVWPKPQQQVKETTYYTFNCSHFKFTVTKYSCDILSSAVKRYTHIVKDENGVRCDANKDRASKDGKMLVNDIQPNDKYKGQISELRIVLTAPCEEYPSLGMNERYSLRVSHVSILRSGSIWGILRGLETFAQLFYLSEDYHEVRINTTTIIDYPSYPHRGLLLDTARHYITVGKILKTLDAMAMNKMNVFHWHIVDDQSFPYQSEKFPELSHKGAFYSSMVYTKEDIERIVQYARARGIRVIPEFDIPGHTRSWGAAFPNVLTQCYSGDKVLGLGPINPLNEEALSLLKNLFAEVQQVFPDKYFHVGGDEVDLDCWSSNPTLAEYIREHSLTVVDLHAIFMKNVIPLLSNDTNIIVWQEVFDENLSLSNNTLVQVWKSWSIIEMVRVLVAGHKVLFSSDWYLSDLASEWTDFYKSDPRRMVYKLISNATVLSNIVGGEACMWGELADDRNVINRVWPRASAVAEKLWNSNPASWGPGAHWDFWSVIPNEVYHRIEEHACRMIRRGFDSQPPSGPGFCVV